MNSSSIPAGKKFLAVMIMISVAYLYWSFFGQPVKQIHKKITTNEVVFLIMVYNNKHSIEIKDDTQIYEMIKLYNEIKIEKPYSGKTKPNETAYIKLKDAELYIASYNQQEVIIQYRTDKLNKQYLAESKGLIKLLKQI